LRSRAAPGCRSSRACIGAAGLELPEGPVTIFAPTDAAFDAGVVQVVDKVRLPEGRAMAELAIASGALSRSAGLRVVPGRAGSCRVVPGRITARELLLRR
jgi:hypothetical protein